MSAPARSSGSNRSLSGGARSRGAAGPSTASSKASTSPSDYAPSQADRSATSTTPSPRSPRADTPGGRTPGRPSTPPPARSKTRSRFGTHLALAATAVVNPARRLAAEHRCSAASEARPTSGSRDTITDARSVAVESRAASGRPRALVSCPLGARAAQSWDTAPSADAVLLRLRLLLVAPNPTAPCLESVVLCLECAGFRRNVVHLL